MSSIIIKGNRLHFSRSGKGDPLIFLHGAFFDSSDYNDIVEILSRRYCVYSFDLPFHGKTEVSGDCRLSVFADLVHEFIKKKDIANPMIYAHSIGAIAAICYASRYRTKRLVLMEPGGIKYFRSFPVLAFRSLLIRPFFVFYYSPKKIVPFIFTGTKKLIRHIFNLDFWRFLIFELNKDYTCRMQEISCKTTLLWAKNDEIIAYRYSNIFLEKIRKSNLIPIDSCHDWPILCPELIKELSQQRIKYK